MKAGVAIIGTLCVVASIGSAFLLGMATATRAEVDKKLRELGWTRETAKLASRARKILVRLAQVTDLDGLRAGDNLSPETKSLINQWVADYRKEINKT